MGADVFGVEPVEDKPEFSDFLNFGLEDAATETPAEPEVTVEEPEAGPTPEPVQATELAEPQTPETPEQAAQTQETQDAGTPAALLAGKYKDAPALEKGYKELRDLQRRTANRAREAEDRASLIEQRAREMEATINRAIPLIRQLQQQQQIDPDAPAPVLTPQVLQPMVEAMVQQRVGQTEQAMRAQFEQTQAANAAQQSVQQFYAQHPEVEVRGEADSAIYDTIQELNENWSRRDGSTIDIRDPEALEVAYEASRDPELRTVLGMHPEYVDTDAGMALARLQANALRGGQPAPTTQTPAPVPAPVQQQAQRKPLVEKASTGATPPTDRPLDEFEEAVRTLRKENQGGLAGSVFG